MIVEKISLSQLQEEVQAMLNVCFEGTILKLGNMLEMTLPNGQSFLLTLQECSSER